MEYTHHSRKLNLDITFSRPGSGYIYADLNGEQGTLGRQICHGGEIMGPTISYRGDSYKRFAIICQKWARQYVSQTDPR